MSTRDHWENVYRSRSATEVSWYAPHLEPSLRLITSAAPTGARIIDVGGGSSTLVDDLLILGYGRVAVLDISAAALSAAREWLGRRADAVQWLDADVTDPHNASGVASALRQLPVPERRLIASRLSSARGPR